VNKKSTHIVLCGGSNLPLKYKNIKKSHLLRLTYDPNSPDQNVSIELPHFVKTVNCHIPNRIKDLLELAGYVYAADRLTKRGTPNSVEYHSWSRSFNFIIKVRDFEFWNNQTIKNQLNIALCFLSGDMHFDFTFEKGGKDVGQLSVFDKEGVVLDKKDNSSVALFSGGLDSLAGVLEYLETTNNNLILISHRSNNPGITQLQDGVFKLLQKDYEGRIQYYPFYCNLKGERAVEETQRTRIFLYTTIAYALSSLASKDEILVYENGMTSINFYKRQDLINARASRTTHPKALKLLEDFYSSVGETRKYIRHPFLFNTKTDIFLKIKKFNKTRYLNSTISCTKTFLSFENNSQATHCGGCSQCIDRRFAAFASNCEDEDAIYDIDLSKDEINNKEAKSHLFDYIKLVADFNQTTILNFPYNFIDVLTNIMPFIHGDRNTDKINKVFKLTKTHTNQVLSAIQRIKLLDNPLVPKKNNTIHSYIDNREYLKPPIIRFIEMICNRLSVAIPEAYDHEKPKHENALNDLINAILMADSDDYEREFPYFKYSISKTIPDHSFSDKDLLIEAKYLRKKTAKSAITDGIAADLTKYPEDKHKLFVVYDPERRISNDSGFKKDLERKPNCTIQIIR
jgi:REase_DpnII-MboI